MLFISVIRLSTVSMFLAGMMRSKSSANFISSLPSVTGRKSEAFTIYLEGPSPDPRLTPEFTPAKGDVTVVVGAMFINQSVCYSFVHFCILAHKNFILWNDHFTVSD